MDAFLGQIERFPYYEVPPGWAPCDGRELPINGNEALFSLIGTKFGGDGMTKFALPNLEPHEIGHEQVWYGIALTGIFPQRGDELPSDWPLGQALTMDKLSVAEIPYPENLVVPAGLGFLALESPETLVSRKACPVLKVGEFTLWPMSYADNRMSFGMVMYDPQGQPVSQVEKRGARYICRIVPEGFGTSGTVTFWGQSNHKVVMSLDEIESLTAETLVAR